MPTDITRRPQALLAIDAENQTDLDIWALMEQLSDMDIVERHAYADPRNPYLRALLPRLKRAGFQIHNVWSGRRLGALKNTADGHMARGICAILFDHPDIEIVVIVSGDKFFVVIAKELKEEGKQVIVAANPCNVSKELLAVAHRYIRLGKLAQQIGRLALLEQENWYLTFGFALQQMDVTADELGELVNRGLLIQETVWRPRRGFRPEIRLNHQAYVVQAALAAMH